MKTTRRTNTILEHFRSFQSIKQKYPDALILLKIADDYMAFEKDAEIIHQITGNKISALPGTAITCSFPFLQLDIHLHKLVIAGNRVAVCDQLENPKK